MTRSVESKSPRATRRPWPRPPIRSGHQSEVRVPLSLLTFLPLPSLIRSLPLYRRDVTRPLRYGSIRIRITLCLPYVWTVTSFRSVREMRVVVIDRPSRWCSGEFGWLFPTPSLRLYLILVQVQFTFRLYIFNSWWVLSVCIDEEFRDTFIFT